MAERDSLLNNCEKTIFVQCNSVCHEKAASDFRKYKNEKGKRPDIRETNIGIFAKPMEDDTQIHQCWHLVQQKVLSLQIQSIKAINTQLFEANKWGLIVCFKTYLCHLKKVGLPRNLLNNCGLFEPVEKYLWCKNHWCP